MKIKRIKKITLGCYEFKIIWDKTRGGGAFSFNDSTIRIGVKYPDDTYIWGILCHEISEVLHAVNCTRFNDTSSGDNYHFFMDHKLFEIHSLSLSTALMKFIS